MTEVTIERLQTARKTTLLNADTLRRLADTRPDLPAAVNEQTREKAGQLEEIANWLGQLIRQADTELNK